MKVDDKILTCTKQLNKCSYVNKILH